MIIKTFKAYTPSMRNKTVLRNFSILKNLPEKKLLQKNNKKFGRNNKGHITVRHIGGGHKKRYRFIDFKRQKINIEGIVSTIEYDPNRNCNISLIKYSNGDKKYILHPEKLKIGQKIYNGNLKKLLIGNSLPLKYIPIGFHVHNIEFFPGKGGQIARSAGNYAKILTKGLKHCLLKLPSGQFRILNNKCLASIGKIDNFEYSRIIIGKAGRNRWKGIRPTVRGSAMNPIDHPHGGGEGKAPIGRKSPVTPWGKPFFGIKTRKNKKKSSSFIVHSF